MSDGKFYVTTPIYYVNFKPHIGTSYTTVLTDVACRFQRLMGEEALLVTGSDEHSQNIADLAEAAGKAPREYCDEVIPKFRDCWQLLQIQDYRFERTSDERHHRVTRKFWQRIHDNGDIYKGEYSGWYHTSDNRFLDPDEVPENPEQHPRLKHLTEEAYYFRLSAHEDWLLELLRENPDFIVPSLRRNEILARVEGGLRDICISRTSTDWGIPLPWDEGHVFYVWVEALLTYLTGSGFDLDAFLGTFEDGRSTEVRERLWDTSREDLKSQPPENHWPADVHVMAKDIPWFHAVIWPAMLHSFGAPPPKKLLVHGYWQFDGEKMSKSLGNVVDPYDAAKLVGVDGLRYFLCREVSVGRDGNFNYEALVQRYKGDLGNDLGNLVHRTVSMLHQSQGGAVPEASRVVDEDLAATRRHCVPKVLASYRELRFSEALQELWELVGAANQAIARHRPWEWKKDESRRAEIEAVFVQVLDAIRVVTLLVSPVMPGAAARFWKILNLSSPLEEQRLDDVDRALPVGHVLNKSEVVFARLDEKLEKARKADTGAAEASAPSAKDDAKAAPGGKKKKSRPEPSAAKAEAGEGLVDIDHFAAVKLQVAEVKLAEQHPKADRLLRLEVDDGERVRQIVAGLAEHYAPADLVGKRVVLVANLKPAKLRGLVSEGMLLAANDAEGRVRLVTPDGDCGVGAEVR